MRAFLDRLRPWGPLSLRLALAAILVWLGFTKAFRTMPDFIKHVADLGLPRWVAVWAAWSELAGGVLLGVGLATRLAALVGGAALLVVEFRGVWSRGFEAIELPVLALAACLSLVLSGAGKLSIDHRLFGRGE